MKSSESPKSPKSPKPPKSQRILACLACQQRKIKCDRNFPCSACVRQGAQCVPAGLVPRPPRRRRFPERELLHRVRHYEELLCQNDISFEPLHGDGGGGGGAGPGSPAREDEGRSSPSVPADGSDAQDMSPTAGKATARSKEAVDFLHAIGRVDLGGGAEEHDDDDGNTFGNTDKQGDDYLLLFGQPSSPVNLSALHPDQTQIFKLWQIYLENVNPLLKVIHTPSMQPRILDAASNLANMQPSLEVLIFSIYCISARSLSDDECRSGFGSPKKDLLARYHFACQQALLRCRMLQCSDTDSLTALYLYLVSVGTQTDPRSLSSMLAIAIRTAQRAGMHLESTNARYSPLHAEMRRRLWWSLVVFDHRICEMSEYKTTTLVPTWDCSPPLNVNDFEIRENMKVSPGAHKEPTEALFTVVRSDLANLFRCSSFHLDFINPALNTLSRPKSARTETLKERIENKYLSLCDSENPLHFMTIWTTRDYLARIRLLEYYSRCSTQPAQDTDARRKEALSYALSMLECDTRLRTSPLTKGYLWFVDYFVPGLAYNHILNALRRRPAEPRAQEAWDAMSDNYEARATRLKSDKPNIIAVFSQAVLQTWAAREASPMQKAKAMATPRIVRCIRDNLADTSPTYQQICPGDQIIVNQYPMAVPVNFGAGLGPAGHPDLIPGWADLAVPFQASMDVERDQFWGTIDWRMMRTQGW